MRQRNLFTESETYAQDWSLAFFNPLTRKRYFASLDRLLPFLHRQYTLLFLLLVITCVYPQTEASNLAPCVVALALCTVTCGTRAVQRLLFSLPCTLVALTLVLETECWSYAEELLVLFPGAIASTVYTDFFTVRHWSTALLCSLSERLLLSWFAGLTVCSSVLPLVGYGVLHGLLQKDCADLWALGDSFERSEQHYKYVFENCAEACFVTSKEGIVLYCNVAGRKLAAALGTSHLRYGVTNVLSLFQEENTVKLSEMLHTSSLGESDEKELILNRLPISNLEPEQFRALGVQARSQALLWKHNSPCVLLALEDVTLYIARRHILTQRYRSLYEAVADFQSDLERLFDRQEVVPAKQLSASHKLYMDYGNALLLQAYIMGRAEMKKEAFHLRVDTENACEIASYRFAERFLDLVLSREEAFPTAIFSDKLRYSQLIINLLSFAAEHARAGSEVSLHCSIAVMLTQGAQEGQVVLGFRLLLQLGRDLTLKDLEELLGKGKRRALQDVVRLRERLGTELCAFETLLQLLRGSVNGVSLASDSGRLTVLFTMPAALHSASAPSTPVTIGTNREMLSPLSLRWRARQTPSTTPKLQHASGSIRPAIKIWRDPETSSVSSSDDSILVQDLDLQDSPPLCGESPRKVAGKATLKKLLIVEGNSFSRKTMLARAGKAGFGECDEAKDETEALQMYRILALQSVFYFAIFVSVAPSSQHSLALAQHIRSLEQASGYPHTRILALGQVPDSASVHLFDCIGTSYTVSSAGLEEGLLWLNQPKL